MQRIQTLVLNGPEATSRLFDDVYKTLQQTGGEVFINGIDERKFLAVDRDAIEQQINRLAAAGITERLLAREGDSFFFPGPQSIYRWVPEHLFNPTPIYVYGNKVAMMIWDPEPSIIIIQNPAIADAYRKQFLFIWERAAVPPAQKTTEDERVRLTNAIIKRFGGRVSPITDKDRQAFRDTLIKEKSSSYGNSFYYLCQAANGVGEQKLGLKFYDGKMLAPIGIFNRTSLGGGWHFHIIHPTGDVQSAKLLSLTESMLELSGKPVFIKKLTKEQQKRLLRDGFSPIEHYPWHAQAIEEDDTFPEQTIDIVKTITMLEKPGRGDPKQYRRFYRKYGEEIIARQLTQSNIEDARSLVKKFFEYLEVKQLHISTPSDYDNILLHPPLGKHGKTHLTELLYLHDRPIAFYAAEPISTDTAGLYANITLHQKIPYLSEYLIAHVCKTLQQTGFKFLNLGGSETGGLFQFKEKFSPVTYHKMHWVVYKFS